MSVFRFTGSLFLFLSLVCAVVATAIDYWHRQHVKLNTWYFGLWESCQKIEGQNTTCYSWANIKNDYDHNFDISWLRVCQAFMIVGVFWNVVAFLGAVYVSLKGMSVKLPRVVAVISAICYLVTVIVFGTEYYDKVIKMRGEQPGGELHAGFGLAVIAILLDLIGAAVAGVGQAASGYQNL